MKIGQMSFSKLSDKADYLQLDICGLNEVQALEKYLKFDKQVPVILHGDWTKKGHSENNILERKNEYIKIIHKLKQNANVIAITIHPPFRKKVSLEDFLLACDDIELDTKVPVYIENRSNQKIWVSEPTEVIEFSKNHKMTIDIPQLLIACKYDVQALVDVLGKILWENVKELHLANVKRVAPNTFVARKLTDGELNYLNLVQYLYKVDYATLEILGGIGVFEKEKSELVNLLDGLKSI